MFQTVLFLAYLNLLYPAAQLPINLELLTKACRKRSDEPAFLYGEQILARVRPLVPIHSEPFREA